MNRQCAIALTLFALAFVAVLSPVSAGTGAAQASKAGVNKHADPLAAVVPVYLENAKAQHFIELRETDNHMRIRRGKIGIPCLVYDLSWITPGAGRKQFDRLRKYFGEQGYVATEPSRPIIEGSKAGQFFTDEILNHPRYSKFFDLGWASELRTARKRIIHFASGLQYDADFDLDEIADMDLDAGLIIDGDVRVKGVFSQLSYTYPTSTLIFGNVRASSFGHADSYLRIEGDLAVDNIIYGYYNDGQLEVTGTASGRLWYSADHSMSAGEYRIKKLDWGETDGLCADLKAAEEAEDDSFDDVLRARMYSGESPLCEAR